MKNYLMVIKADYNDADYVTAINEISEKRLYKIQEILSKHNIRNSIKVQSLEDLLGEKDYVILRDYFPYGPECQEIHTIDEIIFYEIKSKITAI